MNTTTLSKNELISHTALIVSTEDHTIDTPRAEIRGLQDVAALQVAVGVLF